MTAFLGASLIVKDEAQRLPACLASVRGLVDEIVVYDTGSTDGTPEIASAAGALVVRGEWPGSFAEARNRALDLSTATWVLTVDADEEVAGDPFALRNYLADSRSRVVAVKIDNIVQADRTADFSHHHTRLFRREGLRWKGFVHEVLSDDEDRVITPDGLDPELLSIVHHGYSSREVVHAKGQRNAAIVTDEVLRLAADGEPTDLDLLQPLLVHLIRSREGSGDHAGALALARAMHEVLPTGHPSWTQATDQLVQLSLAAGRGAAAEPALRRWRAQGGSGPWLDYLDASVHAAVGDRSGAAALLDRVGRASVVEDTAGVRLAPERLRTERAVLR